MSKIDEKIGKAAMGFARQEHKYGDIQNFDALYKGFCNGAKWALSHQWVSVEDELPENEQYVLVCYNDAYGLGFGVAGYFDNEWYTADDNLKIDKIAAWMPFPSPPEARKEDEVC